MMIEQSILFLVGEKEKKNEKTIDYFISQNKLSLIIIIIFFLWISNNNVYEIDPLNEILIDETPPLKTIYYFATKFVRFPQRHLFSLSLPLSVCLCLFWTADQPAAEARGPSVATTKLQGRPRLHGQRCGWAPWPPDAGRRVELRRHQPYPWGLDHSERFVARANGDGVPAPYRVRRGAGDRCGWE